MTIQGLWSIKQLESSSFRLAGKRHLFSGHRMPDLQTTGTQSNLFSFFCLWIILLIPCQRHMAGCHLYPYLMMASGEQLNLKQGIPLLFLQHFIIKLCLFGSGAPFAYRLRTVCFSILFQKMGLHSFFFFRDFAAYRLIIFLHLAILHLRT